MGKNDLRSQSLDLLRFPLAVVVLTIHTFSSEGIIVKGNQFTFDSYDFFIEVNRWIDAFLRGQSVPIYYFISGFVFFLGVEMTKETYIRKYKNRVKTLVIPYFVWNIMALLAILLITLNPLFSYFTAGVSYDFSLKSFLACFWVYENEMYPINVPLWFIRDLIIVVLTTPILHWMIKKVKHYFVIALGVVWFVAPYFEVETYGFEMAYFFFSWGAYMSINGKDMLEEFGRYFKVSVVLYFALAFLHIFAAHYYPEATSTIKQINVLVGLFFAYNISAWLLKRGVCKVSPFLASASFFIYVSHIILVGRVTKFLLIIFSPASNAGFIGAYTFSVVFTVCLLLGVFYIMKIYTPGLLKVMAGRK